MTSIARELQDEIDILNQKIANLTELKQEAFLDVQEGLRPEADLDHIRQELQAAIEKRDDRVQTVDKARQRDEERRRAAEQAQVVADFRSMPAERDAVVAAAQRFDDALTALIEAARDYERLTDEVEAGRQWCGEPWGVFQARMSRWERISLPEHFNGDHKSLAEVSGRYWSEQLHRWSHGLHQSGLIAADELHPEPGHKRRQREEREKLEASYSGGRANPTPSIRNAEGKEIGVVIAPD